MMIIGDVYVCPVSSRGVLENNDLLLFVSEIPGAHSYILNMGEFIRNELIKNNTIKITLDARLTLILHSKDDFSLMHLGGYLEGAEKRSVKLYPIYGESTSYNEDVLKYFKENNLEVYHNGEIKEWVSIELNSKQMNTE